MNTEKQLREVNNNINRIQTNYNAKDSEEWLKALAEQLVEILCFDLFAVNIHSSDLAHRKVIFWYPEHEKFNLHVRWIPVGKFNEGSIGHEIRTGRNPKDIFELDALTEARKEELMKQLESKNYKEYDSRIFFCNGQSVSTIYFLYVSPNISSEKRYEILNILNIEPLILALLSHRDKETERRREKLFEDISSIRKPDDIARKVCEWLAEQYEWQNVTVYLVNNAKKQFTLCAQKAGEHYGYKIDDSYSQPFERGILGYVFRKKMAVNVSNVSSNAEFRDIFVDVTGKTRSEICVPITVEDEIRWLINIGDRREQGFSKDEARELKKTVKHLGDKVRMAFE